MSSSLRLTVPRSLGAFVELTPTVDAFLVREGVRGRPAHAAHLVLEEVLRNLVEHAHGGTSDEVGIELEVVPSCLRIVIQDDCEPFDPRQVPPPDLDAPLEARSSGGMGLHLLRSMTSALRYRRAGDRNRLEADVPLTEGPSER